MTSEPQKTKPNPKMPGNDCQEKERGLLTLATARNSILFRMTRERNRVGSGEKRTKRKKSPPQDSMKPNKPNARTPHVLHQLPSTPNASQVKARKSRPKEETSMRKLACHAFSTTNPHLQPRINDIRDCRVGVGIPITASLSDGVGNDSLRDLVRSLHDVDVQTSRHVPCDVAMERPHTWIVRHELNDNVARGTCHRTLDDLHITSLRVGLMDNGAIPCADTFGQHVEIVTV